MLHDSLQCFLAIFTMWWWSDLNLVMAVVSCMKQAAQIMHDSYYMHILSKLRMLNLKKTCDQNSTYDVSLNFKMFENYAHTHNHQDKLKPCSKLFEESPV